jgi:hypothetical protein
VDPNGQNVLVIPIGGAIIIGGVVVAISVCYAIPSCAAALQKLGRAALKDCEAQKRHKVEVCTQIYFDDDPDYGAVCIYECKDNAGNLSYTSAFGDACLKEKFYRAVPVD